MKKELKMARNKSLIEKIWWVIPPVFVMLMILVFIPLIRAFDEMMTFSLPIGLFIRIYIKNLSMFLEDYFLNFFGRIVTISTFGFMGFGYYLVRRKSLSLRIIVPIIFAIIGFFILAYIVGMMVYGY